MLEGPLVEVELGLAHPDVGVWVDGRLRLRHRRLHLRVDPLLQLLLVEDVLHAVSTSSSASSSSS